MNEPTRGREHSCIRNWLIFAAIVFASVALLVDVAVPWAAGAWVGLLTGLAANSCALAFGVAILDSYNERRRQNKWAPIHKAICSTIGFALFHIGSVAASMFRVDDKEVKAAFDANLGGLANIGDALKRMAERFPRLAGPSLFPEPAETPVASDYATARRYMKAIGPRCERIRETLTLAVQAEDLQLTRKLTDFSSAVNEFEATLQHWSVVSTKEELVAPFLAARIGVILSRGSELWYATHPRADAKRADEG